jgi:hypothetical protein
VTARLGHQRVAACMVAGLCLALGAIGATARTVCATSSPPQAVACAWALVDSASGATEERQVSDALATLRRHPAQAGAIAEPLARGLQHQSRINRGRDKASVLRLRAMLMQTLTALGHPELALAAVHDTLGYLDERSNATLLAAAARTAGALGAARGKALVPHLVALLSLRVGDESVWLEHDSMSSDLAATTHDSLGRMSTAHLEALVAIGRICSERDVSLARAILSAPSVAGPGADRRVKDLASRVALRLGGVS